MRPRQALTIVAVVLGVLLAACSSQDDGGGESDKSKTSSASSSPSERNGVARTKLEPAMRAKVESIVRSYFNALNKAYKTGDTAEVKALAHEKCGFCHQLTSYIEGIYGQGGRIEGGQAGEPRDVTIGDLITLTEYGIRQVHYAAKIPGGAHQSFDRSGKVIDSDKAEVVQAEFTVELDQSDKMTIRTWRIR